MIATAIAITGATGFVGQRLVKLLQQNAKQFAAKLLVRDVARARASGLDAAPCSLVEGALDCDAALDTLCADAEVVIHLAGAITARDDAAFMTVNRDGTAAVLKAAQKAGVRDFILISSLAARAPEISGYAASKSAAEEIVREHASAGMRWLIVRPPAVYGPGDKATLPLLKALLQRVAVLPGSEQARFSMIYADDLADAILTLASTHELREQVIELDDGKAEGYSWNELADIVSDARGKPVKTVFLPQFLLNFVANGMGLVSKVTGGLPMVTRGKVRELYHPDWVCTKRAVQENGIWSAKTRFSEGFEKTVSWYRGKGWI
ncbi:MAG: NAD-dependent epimerase/dehydratase family protein [Hyphomicrobiales bacterium]